MRRTSDFDHARFYHVIGHAIWFIMTSHKNRISAQKVFETSGHQIVIDAISSVTRLEQNHVDATFLRSNKWERIFLFA